MKRQSLFIFIFILFTFFQFLTSSHELFPFSSFGMYKNIVAEKDFREYSIIHPIHRDKDLLLSLGDRRFFIQHQLNQVSLSEPSQFKKGITQSLRKYLSKDVLPLDSIFIVKYWYKFTAEKYNTPDLLFEIPIREVRQ